MSENRARGARASGRRALLKGLFGAALLPPIDPRLSLAGQAAPAAVSPFAHFDPIAPTDADDMIVPDGFTYPGEVVNEREDYRVFKNGGVFRVPVTGTGRGAPGLFASMSCEAEPTGPAFGPGEQALFLSVQHPGERYGARTDAMAAPRGSNWPHGKVGAPPPPAVVAIRRKP